MCMVKRVSKMSEGEEGRSEATSGRVVSCLCRKVV